MSRSDLPGGNAVRHLQMVDESCELQRRPDGSILMRRQQALAAYPQRYTEWLVRWAQEAPERIFIAQRPRPGATDRPWNEWTYGAAWAAVRSIGQALLARGLSRERPVMILSENQVENQLLALACTHVGVPYIPVAPAYSLLAKDHAQLKALSALCQPALVYVSNTSAYRAALLAAFTDAEWVATVCDGTDATSFADLLKTKASVEVDRAFDALGPEDLVKILFTSGTTGTPKGVMFTHRMICSNRQQTIQSLPLIFEQTPVLVDWMPWHHTFGGTHCVGIALTGGGSYYIDPGLPLPGRIEGTVQALREIAPTFYASTPGGMAVLLPYLKSDEILRRNFVSKLTVMQYGGAPLPQHVRRGFDEVVTEAGGSVSFVSGIGSTECGPNALTSARDPGCEPIVGVPGQALEVKLAPVGERLELRCKGPCVTPGYWKQPELNSVGFDEEGFFRLGDAVSFVDPARPELGLRFEGRLAENFKLSTGTWVNTAGLRDNAIKAFIPLAREVVIAGEGRDEVGALVFADIEACRALDPALPADVDGSAVLASERVRSAFAQRLATLAEAGQGSAGRITRIALETELPSVDNGELTAKQSVSAATVLRRRADVVNALFSTSPGPRVIQVMPRP